jgi:hypothetical protein
MTAHTSFLDYVLPHVPGCTNELALHEIKNTIIDFCEKSLVLQADQEPVTIIAGINEYDLDPPKDRLVVKILRAWYKAIPLEAVAPDAVNTSAVYNPNSGVTITKADPRWYIQKDPRTYTLYPIPKDTARLALTMRLALKPTRAVTSIDDIIFEEYVEIIGHGAIARLAISPGKPYTNLDLAMGRASLYQAGLNVARDRAQKGYARANRRVQLRRV